jgi:hypothetical protein
MKEDVLLEGGEAEGESVANKMNLVSPLAEMDPELCGNGSASAVGGIAGDADLHMSFSFIVQGSQLNSNFECRISKSSGGRLSVIGHRSSSNGGRRSSVIEISEMPPDR